MRVALVHDWLTGMAGAERVVLELHKLFPDAPIYTSVFDPEKAWGFKDADVRTSFIQKLPLATKKHQLYAMLRRKAFESFDFSEYDLVISSSGSEAKGIITKSPTIHINYCHSPTHYYWANYEDYLKNPGFGALDPVMRAGLKAGIKRSRKWDYAAAQRPDYFLANSNAIKAAITKYYDRDSVTVFPPVDIERFRPSKSQPREGFLVVGRQVPFKRIDLAVQACTQLGVKLRVVGHGSEHERLKAMAGPSVEFYTNVSDAELANFYHTSAGFIWSNEEDFGIVMAEAQAAGCPVIAYRAGGALDIVKDGATGLLFDEQTPESLAAALGRFNKLEFDEKTIIKNAERFSPQVFDRAILDFVKKVTQ